MKTKLKLTIYLYVMFRLLLKKQGVCGLLFGSVKLM